jgi:hypothetical protein
MVLLFFPNKNTNEGSTARQQTFVNVEIVAGQCHVFLLHACDIGVAKFQSWSSLTLEGLFLGPIEPHDSAPSIHVKFVIMLVSITQACLFKAKYL